MRALLFSSTLLLACLLVPPAVSQTSLGGTLEARLAPSVPSESGGFGFEVRYDNDRAIIIEIASTTLERRVRIFERTGSGWAQEFSAPLPLASQAFPSVSVDIDGDVAVVGLRSAESGGGLTGVVRVYERQGGSWVEVDELAPPSAVAGDGFGTDVDLDGDLLAVGAAYSDGGAGSAFVFRRTGGGWMQQARLTANDAAANDWFGTEVAIEDDMLLVGSLRDDDRGSDSGSAYVFERDGTQWSQIDKLRPSANTDGANFGRALVIRGDLAVIGAPRETADGQINAGAVYAFSRDGASWSLSERLTADAPTMDQQWGWSLDLGPGRMMVGVGPGPASQADAFTRSGTEWTHETTLVHPDGEMNPGGTSRFFGYSVALDGQRAIVTAVLEDTPPPVVVGAGAAYVFDLGVFVGAEDAPTAYAVSLSAPAPNPARDRAVMTLGVAAPVRAVATLHDALGRRVAVLLDADVSGPVRLDVPTADLAPGVYTVRVETAGGSAVRRLSVVR